MCIRDRYENAEIITLVMDNLNTHTPGSFYETFDPNKAKALWDRFEFVYTPKHGSWLNMAEIELNVPTGQCLNRRIYSIEDVRTAETESPFHSYQNPRSIGISAALQQVTRKSLAVGRHLCMYHYEFTPIFSFQFDMDFHSRLGQGYPTSLI